MCVIPAIYIHMAVQLLVMLVCGILVVTKVRCNMDIIFFCSSSDTNTAGFWPASRGGCCTLVAPWQITKRLYEILLQYFCSTLRWNLLHYLHLEKISKRRVCLFVTPHPLPRAPTVLSVPPARVAGVAHVDPGGGRTGQCSRLACYDRSSVSCGQAGRCALKNGVLQNASRFYSLAFSPRRCGCALLCRCCTEVRMRVARFGGTAIIGGLGAAGFRGF
jgi:hypothetical protein